MIFEPDENILFRTTGNRSELKNGIVLMGSIDSTGPSGYYYVQATATGHRRGLYCIPGTEIFKLTNINRILYL